MSTNNKPPQATLLYELIDLANRRKHSLEQLSDSTLTTDQRAFWQDHLELVESAQAARDFDMKTDPLGMALWFYADGNYDQASALLRRVKGQFPQ
jgi:hypothetical protein